MQTNAYLIFDGRCAEAFGLYERCFGGKIEMIMTYSQSPMPEHTAPEWRDKVMHATLRAGNDVFMGMDAAPNYYQKPQGFFVNIGLDDEAEAERLFQELSEGGTVKMPLQQTFWAARFGMLVDQFGTPWMINCSK